MKRLINSLIIGLFAMVSLWSGNANAQCSGITLTARDYKVCEQNSVQFFISGYPANSTMTWHFGNQTVNATADSVRFIAIKTGTFKPYVIVKTPSNVTCRVDLPVGKEIKVFGKPKNLSLSVSPGTEICELGGLTKISVNGGTSDMRYTFDVGTVNGPSDDNFYRSISASNSLTRRYYVEGYKYLFVEIRNGNGCRTIIREDSLFSVSNLPVPNISFKDQNNCDKKEIDFTTNLDPSLSLTYAWSFEDASPSVSSFPTPKNIVFEGEGKYDVSLKVQNGQGCTREVLKKDLIVVGKQKIIDLEIRDNNVCTGEELVVKQIGSDLSNGSVSWLLGGASVAYTNPKNTLKRISYASTGNFDIGLRYNAGGCVTEVVYNDTIRVDKVNADFSMSAPCNCVTEEISFTNRSSTTDPEDSLMYKWTIKDQHGFTIYTSRAKNPKYQFTQMGNYTIQLDVSGRKGCSSTKTKSIDFGPLRAAFNVSDDKACLGETITASIDPAITCLNNMDEIKWKLINENGVVVDSQSTELFSHTFKETGKYAIELYVRNKSQCEDFAIKFYAVDVYQLETSITTDYEFACANDRIELEMKNAPYNVGSKNNWLIIDSTTSARFTGTGTKLNFNITEPGTFDVILVASRNAFCADTVILKDQFKVSGAKAEIITRKRESCVPFTDIINAKVISNIQHRDTNYNVTYKWGSTNSSGISFADVNNDTTEVTITQSNNYGLTLELTNAEGCKTTFSKSKAYEAGVVSRWTSNSTACVDVPLKINNRSYVNAKKFKWLVTDTNVTVKPKIRAEEPRFIFKEPGRFRIGLVAENDIGCIDTFYRNINVIDFNFNFTSPESNSFLCAPALVEFNVKHTNVDSFVWTFGDGDTVTTSDTVMGHFYDILDLDPNNEYPFDIQLIGISNYGCQDTLTKEDFIKLSGPRPKFVPDTLIGSKEVDVEFLDLNVGVRYYLFDYGDNSSVDSNVMNTHTYVLDDTTKLFEDFYPKMVAFDDRGCSRTLVLDKPIRVYNGAKTRFVADTLEACENVLVQFRNFSTLADSFQWFVGGSDSVVSYDRNPVIGFKEGTHTVTLKAFNINGDGTNFKRENYITVYENPTVEMSVDFDFYCEGREASFTDRSYGKHIISKRIWDFNNNWNQDDTSSLVNPTYTYPTKGVFDVRLWVQDEFGCFNEKVFENAVEVGDPLPINHNGISYVSYASNNVVKFNVPENDTLGTHGFLISSDNKLLTPIGQQSGTALSAGDYQLRVPSQNTYYQLLAINDCRDTVDVGKAHKPVVLKISEKSGTFFPLLEWTRYNGWNAVTNYEVVRTTNGEKEETIALLSANDTTYVDSLVCNNFYSYFVRASESRYASNSTVDTISPAYEGPTGETELFTTTVVDNKTILTTWQPHSHPQVTEYLVSRSDPNFGLVERHAVVEDTFFLDNIEIFADRDIYKYTITGIDYCLSKSESSIESNSIVVGITRNENNVDLEWNLFENWPNAETTYYLEKATESTEFETIFSGKGTTVYQDKDIFQFEDEIFRYRIKAVYGNRIAYSNIVREFPDLKVYIPNAFSPNNDGINDIYKVTGSGGETGSAAEFDKFRLIIINRWGETVYENNNLADGWDGTYKGVDCPIGTYVFHVEFRDKTGKFQYYQGNITLLR
ncbi:MAG: gliding motility-associated C-terminal domain-containing protein [Bacteroidia bacterium]